jgi:hypothetical protein
MPSRIMTFILYTAHTVWPTAHVPDTVVSQETHVSSAALHTTTTNRGHAAAEQAPGPKHAYPLSCIPWLALSIGNGLPIRQNR